MGGGREGGGVGVGREVDKPSIHPLEQRWPPGVATIYLPCQGDVHGAMAAVPGLGCPIGAL